MNKNFIHRGCVVTIDGEKIIVRKNDGSKFEKICLRFLDDYDMAEQFVKNYIDLNLHEKIDMV